MATNYQSAPDGKGPVIVHGTIVGGPQAESDPIFNEKDGTTYTKPSPPERGCRDVFWGFLFYAHIAGMIAVAVMYGPQLASGAQDAVNNYNGGGGGGRMLQSVASRFLQDDAEADAGEIDLDVDPAALATIVALCTVIALVLSTVALGFMMSFAEALIKMALWFNIIVYGVLGILSLVSGAAPAGIMFLVFCGIAAWYAYRVWGRIPFAASNLVTAVSAVKSNLGLAFYAYWSTVIVFLWMILWSVSTASAMYVLGECEGGECQKEVGGFLGFLFLVSLYWTLQVISNVVHVSVAGTVGTWWFSPTHANGCCSRAVRDSYVRSLTTSFGSICLGSLIVALIQATREIARQARESGDNGILLCLAECILGCIESIVEYFNKWAYVYVGLYG